MDYTIKAHPTEYKNIVFRSRLEARYAAFFDLLCWEWEYEPIDFKGWTPDFRLKFPCYHSECPSGHTLFVEIKPYYCADQFNSHRCMDFPYGGLGEENIPADAGAGFGIDPSISIFEMCHGSGGGFSVIIGWLPKGWKQLWDIAGNTTRYQPKDKPNRNARFTRLNGE